MLQLDAAAQRCWDRSSAADVSPGIAKKAASHGAGSGLMRRAGDPEWHADPYVNLRSMRQHRGRQLRGDLRARDRPRAAATPAAGPAGRVLARATLESRHHRLSNGHSMRASPSTSRPWHVSSPANPRLRLEDAGFAAKPFVPYWRDALDRTLRIRGVRDNLFVQRQLPWPAHPLAVKSRRHPALRSGELKNGQQMMASEGVIATLFHHLLDQPSPSTAALRFALHRSHADATRRERERAGPRNCRIPAARSGAHQALSEHRSACSAP